MGTQLAKQQKNIAKPIVILSFLVLAGIIISACGGGGESNEGVSTAQLFPTKTLRWNPPTSFADGTPLNPATDLDRFEIYVKQDGTFSDADTPMATLAAHDYQSNQTTTSFNLANLGPYLSKGVVYHVSLRATTKDNVNSPFSTSVTFSF